MLAAFLTAFLFALSAVCAGRTTRHIGPFTANLVRLGLSTAILGVWAFGFGAGFHGPGLFLFVLSGVAGFGFSDLTFFAALPLIGSRLASLMVQCLAAPFAALMEWLWLGTRLNHLEMACSAAILAGVGLAIAPSRIVEGTQPAAGLNIGWGCFTVCSPLWVRRGERC